MAHQSGGRVTKVFQVTPQPMPQKITHLKKAHPSKERKPIESFCCPKCKQLLVGVDAIRLRSRPKLTKHMQKLLQKRKQNEKSLTARQHELLQRAMQQCNVLVLKCFPCEWQGEVKLQTRESLYRHKARLRQKAERERDGEKEAEEATETLDKKAMKKSKKKERNRKSAEAKALELQQFKRLGTASPMNGATQRPEVPVASSTPSPFQLSTPSPSQWSSVSGKSAVESRKSMTPVTPWGFPTQTPNKADRSSAKSERGTPSGSTPGVHRGRVQKLDKQKLQKAISQKTKAPLSAKESLSQFLNSLK